jgi:hypothetical protein
MESFSLYAIVCHFLFRPNLCRVSVIPGLETSRKEKYFGAKMRFELTCSARPLLPLRETVAVDTTAPSVERPNVDVIKLFLFVADNGAT